VSGDFQPEDAPQYKVDYYILDTDSKLFGGSGEIFDWKIAVKFKESFPELFLAGGLNPENVRDAIRIVRPFAVDVCSGVEAEKGRKDPVMVCDFVRNAKGAL
jgi:phosphoribosylanthranilate isomerase